MSKPKSGSGPGSKKRSIDDAAARRAAAVKVYSSMNTASRARDKERTALALQLALESLKRADLKVSVVAVAEAVGVHPSLVHHVYPKIAAEISELRRGSGPTKKEREESRLAQALRQLADLQTKFEEAEKSVKTLVSRNATLDARVRSLEEKEGSEASKVRPLEVRSKDKPV